MKLPRLITRRRVKWAGLCATGSILIVAVGSVFLAFTHIWVTPDSENCVQVRAGTVMVLHLPRSPGDPGGVISYILGSDSGLTTGDAGEVRWRFSYDTAPDAAWEVVIPLWIPLLLLSAPTAWLWYTDRRAKPWQCPKCRYDLRGLDGGVCPECGNPTECKT